MKHSNEVDKRIARNFSKLHAYSRLYNRNGEESPKGADDSAYEPYVSKESYCQACLTIRRKLRTFALHYDPTLLQSIMEWEGIKSDEVPYSRIKTRARLIAQSAHRELRGALEG